MREALQRIEDGRTLLAPGKTDMGRIETMFFGALDFIALKFAETPVAEAAQLAWKAIKALLQQFI
jgi:hypothetical protein